MVLRRTEKADRRTRVADPLPSLSDREFLILRALQSNLRQGLYGIEIRDTVAEEFGITLPWGSLYVMLGRLVEKGFAERVEERSEDAPEPRRQHYRLSGVGATALARKATLLGMNVAAVRAER